MSTPFWLAALVYVFLAAAMLVVVAVVAAVALLVAVGLAVEFGVLSWRRPRAARK